MKRAICLIAESLNRSRGGAEGYLADLVGYLIQAGHPVRVYLRRPCRDLPAAEIEVVPTWRGSGFFQELQFARSIQQRLMGTDSIVFSTLALSLQEITHYLPLAGLYCASYAAERASFDPGLRRRFYRLGNLLNLQRQWLMAMQEKLFNRQQPPRIMTFSAALQTQILGTYRVPAANVVTVPLGVNLTCFHPGPEATQSGDLNSSADRLVLLFVGHNFLLKGLHCLLQAIRSAVQRGLKADLLVAGNGPRRGFEALARRLNLAGQVRFLGWVDDAALADLYRASDALVHPTFADHCSLVVLEALASGLPVVTTRLNGAAELIVSGKQGFIVEDPRDIEALTKALLSLQDRKKLAEMSSAAVALRPRLEFGEHARQVLAWLTAEGSNES